MPEDTLHYLQNADTVINKSEEDRVRALNDYGVLNTFDEAEFSRLSNLAAMICDVPISSITFINESNLIFKSGVGFEVRQLSRENTFSNYVIESKELFEVEDALEDERFRFNQHVTGPPYIRYFAGYPLIDPNGFALGNLCVADYKPRKLNNIQRQALVILSNEVVSQILFKKERAEKKQFEELFSRSIDMVCIAGFDGYFKKTNPAFNITLGWTIQELLEKPLIHFIHPDDQQETEESMNILSNEIRSTNFTSRFLTKSGEYKILSWNANPDKLTGIIYAIARDKTEFYQAKRELELAEKKFRAVFENSPDAIFVEDVNGNILDVNSAAIALQGLSGDKLIGSNLRELVPKENYVKLLTDYKKLFFGLVKTIESTLWYENKGKIPVEISGKKFIYNGKPALLLLVRDISERKKLEKERAESLLEKSRLREEQIKLSIKVQEDERNRIASEMHDEVGAGLSRISILGQVIKKSTDNPDLVFSSIEKVLFSSQQVQKNISEIIWAMNTGNDSMVNLLSYLNYYTMDFLDTSYIKTTINFPDNIPSIKISGITRRNIFLIIKESLNNIVKYSKATTVLLDLKIDNDKLIILISDNGIGFDVEKIPRFSNGIQNMKKRITDIGGFISIDSSNQTGTEVLLHVPVSSIVID